MNAMTENLDFPVATQYNSVVKPLDHEFNSFGEALAAWTNGKGFIEQHQKRLNATMVHGFCCALKHTYSWMSSQRCSPWGYYFESDAFIIEYVKKNGYILSGEADWILLDKHHRPIALIELKPSVHVGVIVEVYGVISIVSEVRELVKNNYKIDELAEQKKSYIEVIEHQMRNALDTTTHSIDNERIALPEYYPYLDGGIDALMKDFLESEETVLIIQGPPGTGKTSGVSASITSMDLLPIYAKKSDVVKHKDFVSFVFALSDNYMSRVAGTEVNRRQELIKEQLVKDLDPNQNPFVETKDEEHRIPVVIVEDADALIATREGGNQLMAELLNETDGLGSSTARKIIFNTNIVDLKLIDEALMRPGRCYGVYNFRLLTPSEAVAARKAAELPDFDNVPTENVSLAVALRKPRKRLTVSKGKQQIGFGS